MGEQEVFKNKYDDGVERALTAARMLYSTRGDQYNVTVHLSDYFPGGPKDYLWILQTKVLRLRSLLEVSEDPERNDVGRMNAKAKARDEALDLINYASYLWAELVSERPKEEKEDEPIKGNDDDEEKA